MFLESGCLKVWLKKIQAYGNIVLIYFYRRKYGMDPNGKGR